MDKPLKNYLIYVVLIIITVLLTLFFSKSYLKNNGQKSILYNYISEIKTDDFEQFMTENPDAIIYISSIQNDNNIGFEKKLKKKIDSLNIKENVVFINKETVDSNFLNLLRESYGLNLNINESSLIIINDNVLINCIYVDDNVDFSSIDFSEFR